MLPGKMIFKMRLLALVDNLRTGEKNNWNLSSNEFINFASSLSNFLAQSGKMHKNQTLTKTVNDQHEVKGPYIRNFYVEN